MGWGGRRHLSIFVGNECALRFHLPILFLHDPIVAGAATRGNDPGRIGYRDLGTPNTLCLTKNPHPSRFASCLLFGSTLIIIGIVWSLLLITAGNETVVAAAQRQTGLPISDEAAPGQAISQTLPQTGEADEPGGLASLSAPLLYDTDLGTRSIEFSAVTLNESTNRLVIADDEGRLFEFDLTPEGEPVIPARRTITTAVGDNDIEGLAWMSRHDVRAGTRNRRRLVHR